ncbi:MAG TPA: hypothetical protein VKJ07_17970, partial [Mycobacteriales bacterium]|nr:hypothetical protein [Mycobacteriales bacterium]
MALAISGLSLLAPAAQAAGTSTTFTLSGGALSISVPASANLTPSAVATGTATLSGTLGSTSVTDARGNLTATWTVTVVSTDFQTGTNTANETVPKANVSYGSG